MPDYVFKPKFDYFFTKDQTEEIAGDYLDPICLRYRVKAQAVVTLKEPPSERLRRMVQKALDDFVVAESEAAKDRIVAALKGVTDVQKYTDGCLNRASSTFMSLPTQFDNLVKKVVADEAKRDALVREFKVKTVFKVIVGAAKIAKGATELALTAALDVTAWFSLCKTAKELVDLVREAAKSEDQLHGELLASRDYLQKTMKKAFDARLAFSNAKGLANLTKGVTKLEYEFKLKSRAEEAEKKRQFYRTKVFDTRKKIDKLDVPLRALADEFKALKGQGDLKAGVKVGAALMAARRGHRLAVDVYEQKLGKLDALNRELKVLSVDVDDGTWKEKFEKFRLALQSKNFGEVAQTAKDAASTLNDIKGAVEDIRNAIQTIVR